MYGKYSPTEFANFLYYCITVCAEISTTFGSKVVAISTRNTKIPKIRELRKVTFSVFHSISRPNFGILLPLNGSFREFRFFAWVCLDKKSVYNANCPLFGYKFSSVSCEKRTTFKVHTQS